MVKEGVETRALPWAEGLLIGAGLLGLALAATVAMVAPPAVALAVPFALAVMIALALAVRLQWHPALPTLAVLGFYAPLSGHSDGIDISEVAFGVTYALFLAGWYGSRVLIYRERLVRSGADVAFVIFLAWVAISPVVGLINGAPPMDLLSDLINISYLSLYFPLREVGARYKRGPEMLAGLILLFGVVGVIRVVVTLNQAFASAEHAWQIARGRVTMGELFMYQAALLSLALGAAAARWRGRLVWLAGFGIFTVGLLLTQWRSYYVALAVGIVLLVLLMRGRERARVGLLVVLGTVVAGGFAFLTFGDTFVLMAYGLLNRALSLGTATQDDISLINRGFETRRLLILIAQAPLSGYGPGVSFGFWDAILQRTWVKPYGHNAYLSMVFKYGGLATAAFLCFWAYHACASLWLAVKSSERRYACFVAASLLPLFLTHLVSAAFNTGDTVVAYTFLFAFAAALLERHRMMPRPAGEL